MNTVYEITFHKDTSVSEPELSALHYVLGYLVKQNEIAWKIGKSVEVSRRSERAYDVTFRPFWGDGSPNVWLMASESLRGRGWLVRECLQVFNRGGVTSKEVPESDQGCWDLFTEVVIGQQQKNQIHRGHISGEKGGST